MSEKPGRYQRSFGGLVGAMIIVVVCSIAFVTVREMLRVTPDGAAEPVDWEPAVATAAEGGVRLVHPADLDPDWTVTSAGMEPSQPPTWGMGMLTDAEKFVGIRQEPTTLPQLLDVYVDEDSVEGDPVRLDSELGTRWRTFSDDGGDYALVLEREEDIVMVYGSADESVMQEFVTGLTEEYDAS